MNDLEEFKELVKSVLSPRLREYGFKGSGKRWVKSNEAGDLCVIGLEIDRGYEPFEILFQVGAVPKAWDEWLRSPCTSYVTGGEDEITKQPMHYHGMDVWTVTGPGEEVPDFWPVRSPTKAMAYLESRLGELYSFADAWLDPQEARRRVDEGRFEPYGFLGANPLARETSQFLLHPPSSSKHQQAREALVIYQGIKAWEATFAKTISMFSGRV